jgi:large subunit ribosomal protein L6
MSRLGKLPIELPKGVSAQIVDGVIIVNGPKGELKQKLMTCVKVEITAEAITVSVANPEQKPDKSLWGLYRSLIKNMVVGVSQGFTKQLEVNGVGYKVAGGGKKLNFSLGYSHPIDFDMPEGVSCAVEGKVITLTGSDKQIVGETAARIRRLRPPEPYKGKGIKYVEEVLRRKAGKTAASK